MLRLTKIMILLSLALLLAAGCSEKSSVLNPEGTANRSAVLPVYKIPGGATIDSAKLLLTVSIINSQPVTVHRITADWKEKEVTWRNFNNSYAADTTALFVPSGYGQIAIDITPMVQAWINGTQPNYGVLMRQGSSMSQFRSKEFTDPSGRPKLEIYYSTPAGPTNLAIQDSLGGEVEDAFIGGNFPDGNNGDAPLLMVGNTFGSEQHAMIRFVMPIEEPVYISIGDFVWNDLNADGVQDLEEPGMGDVTVNLYDCADNFIESTATDGSGYYLFDSLELGEYSLEFIAPQDYVFSPSDRGADDGLDSDVDSLTGRTPCFNAEAEGEYLSWDAGMYLPEQESGGCTKTLGYWRNLAHWGRHCVGRDDINSLLPIWLGVEGGKSSIKVSTPEIASFVLWMKRFGWWFNSLNGLYAELLAAKLNIANGADDAEIIAVINDVDNYLSNLDWRDLWRLNWDQRKLLAYWQKELMKYNLGMIGPGRCDDNVHGLLGNNEVKSRFDK